MTAAKRLTPEQWSRVRQRWEGDPRPGFDWLAKEVEAAFGVTVTRQGVSVRASRDEWVKSGGTSDPLPQEVPAVAQQGADVAQHGKSPVAQQDARPARSSQGPVRRVSIRNRRLHPVEVADELIDDENEINDLPTCTPQEEVFAGMVARGRSKAVALIAANPKAAGWKRTTVFVEAWKWANRPHVAHRIAELMRLAAEANEAGVAEVLRQYLQRLYADPRELSEVRVGPCRHCWGQGHRYQYTDGELADKRADHAARVARAAEEGKPQPPAFDERGGGGFNLAGQPNPECPTCAGSGEHRTMLHDSRNYSESALALFEGVEETKEGIKVKTASRTEALEKIARYVGFFEADNAQKGAADQRPDVATLDAMYDKAMAQWQAQREAVQGRMARLKAKGLIEDAGQPGGAADVPQEQA